MTAQTILLTIAGREQAVQRACRVLAALPVDKAWKVTVEAYKPKRSTSQNSMLWAMYAQLLERGGEPLRGYSKEEIHEVLLERFFGAEKYTLFGVEKTRPMGRSSGMSKQIFSDYIEHVVIFAANIGIVLDMPDDQEWR